MVTVEAALFPLCRPLLHLGLIKNQLLCPTANIWYLYADITSEPSLRKSAAQNITGSPLTNVFLVEW